MDKKHWLRHSHNGHKKLGKSARLERDKVAPFERSNEVASLRLGLFDKATVAWKAPQFAHHEKSLLWFIIAGLAALLLVLYGLKTDGWTFSVAILVFAGAYYLVHRHEPPLVEVKISKSGVKIGRSIFPYANLKSFWIVYDPPFVKKLYLRMKFRFQPDLFISLEDADPEKIRHALSGHLNELSGRHEPFSDSLVRLLKL